MESLDRKAAIRRINDRLEEADDATVFAFLDFIDEIV